MAGIRDENAPACLEITCKDNDGKMWGVLVATSKTFSTGSVGFNASGKIVNPTSGKAYQCGFNITLVGSKP